MKLSIMIDIETLGTRPGCVISSIGACVFDRHGTFIEPKMHISGLVTTLPDAIDNATAFFNGPLDDLRTRFIAQIQDQTSRLHRELADIHKMLAKLGIANPDTIYDQAYKACYDAVVRDEHAAIIELLDQRVPA